MFTGLVEGMAVVKDVEARGAARRLILDLGPYAEGVTPGDSVAVAGVCLTVARLEKSQASFDVVAETLACTTLGRLQSEDRVNVERSLRVGDRLGGHFVQGHVDGAATVARWSGGEGERELRLAADRALLQGCILKGSVALDGVSLTIAGLDAQGFHVALVPHTLAVTTLGSLREGDAVNVELDMLGKYVRRLLEGERGDPEQPGE